MAKKAKPRISRKPVDKVAEEAKALSVETTRLALELPIETHMSLKSLAAQQRISMREFVLRALAAAGVVVP